MKKNSPAAHLLASLLVLLSLTGYATNYVATGNGNWSNSAIWSPTGIPGSSDNVTIAHGDSITVNGNYSCNNLTIGDAVSGITGVGVSSGNTLTINGACSINPSNINNYYILNAGAGTIAIAGTFSWGTSGMNMVVASTGTVTFTPAITISASTEVIKLTSTGTINFSSSFTDNYNKLTPFSGSTVNFAGNYTTSTTAATWSTGTAIFSGTGTITANSNLTLFNVQTAASASTTLASASGTVVINGAVTIGSGSTFTASENFEQDGNWTNNGTFAGGTNTVTFNGTTSLTGATTFPYIQIGNTAASNTVTLTINSSVTCLGVTFNGYNKARTLTISNGDTLKVNGNLLINQPTAAKTNNLAVNGGTCLVSGNLTFTGTVTTTSYTSKITITTGALVVTGTTNFDANTAAANQAITITSTGSVTFSSPLVMAYGTISITGSGALNFNGSEPSLTFGGTGTPSFTTTNGCSINFVNGLINNSNTLTFANTSNANFKANGTIKANADINFGNLQFNAIDTIASTGNNVTVAGTMVVSGAAAVTALQSLDITGNSITIGSGGVYTQTSGALTVEGDVVDSGVINVGSSGSVDFDGVGANISGIGFINDPSGTITVSNNKTITAGSTITFGNTGSTTIDITSGTTISNGGTVVVIGSITGDDNTATWQNDYEGALSITGELLDVGALDVSSVPNSVTYNGAGDQTITAPLSSYYDLTVSTGGTKSLIAPAQVDDAVTIYNSVILDEGTNPLTGLASLTMNNDSSELTLDRNSSGTYPELSGAYTLTGGTIIINQTDNPAVLTSAIYYNLVLQGNQAYDISPVWSITNNFDMQNATSISNNYALKIGGMFTYESSAYTSMYDNITTNGITLLSGTLDDGGNNLTIGGAGSWTMSGGSFNATGQTEFAPKIAVAQTIGGSSPATFYDLVINNTNNVTLNLSPAAATNVSGYLDLTNGNLNTDAGNILLMQANAAVLNGSASSYVSGPMQKAGNAAFVFPTGKSGVFGQAGFSGAINPSTVVTAEYFPVSYSTLQPRAAGLTQVSHSEYWMIERTVTSDSLQVQLYWTSATVSDILTCADLTIAHYTGGQWINEPAAAVGGSVCSGTGSGSVLTTGYVSTFSPFTFGSDGGGMALPVTLVSFNAIPSKNVVLTKWQTATEINSSSFTVERSANGQYFEAIGTVKAAGNSTSLLNYSFTDEAPLKRISYYRLKLSDDNGNSTLSNIVSVDFTISAGISVFPNPATNQVSINVPNPSNEIVISIYDMTGRRVFTKTYTSDPNSNNQLISLPTAGNLSQGVYMVTATTDDNDYNEELVVQ